jgi:hypothetical protein
MIKIIIGKYDMAKNFLIGGLSGMIATSCVTITFKYFKDLTYGYD